jgi:hypothetical protein
MVRHLHRHALKRGIPGKEVAAQRDPERLRLSDAIACRYRVDGVLHRIGGEHAAIVSLRVRLGVLSFEPYRDGQVTQVVTIASAIQAQ